MTNGTRIGAALLFAMLGVSAGPRASPEQKAAQKAGHGMTGHIFTPDQLEWAPAPPVLPAGAQVAALNGDMSKKGSEFTVRLRVPDGWTIPAHFHPADEHVTVLEGNFRMGLGDKLDESKLFDLPAGAFHFIPKGVHHYGVAKGKTVLQLHGVGPWGITYVNPSDDPSKSASK